MRLKVALLAVYGDKEARLDQRVDDLDLLLTGMAGDMQIGELVIDDVRTLAVKLVDNAADGLFVAGDGGGGDDDAVSRLNFDLPVAGEGHAVQRGHILAL